MDRLGILHGVNLMACAEACEMDTECRFFTVGVDSMPWCVLCRVAPANTSTAYAITVTFSRTGRTAVAQTTDGAPSISEGGYLREVSLDGYTCAEDAKTKHNSDLMDIDVAGCAVSCFEDPTCVLFSVGDSSGGMWCTKCTDITYEQAGPGGSTIP